MHERLQYLLSPLKKKPCDKNKLSQKETPKEEITDLNCHKQKGVQKRRKFKKMNCCSDEEEEDTFCLVYVCHFSNSKSRQTVGAMFLIQVMVS